MSYYRDVYLKSDEWRGLRMLKILSTNGRCAICGAISTSNDIHHLRYKNLFDVKLKHLKTVCRRCHDDIHLLMKKYPKMKLLDTGVMWATLVKHIRKKIGTAPEITNEERLAARARFNLIKAAVIKQKGIEGCTIVWDDRLVRFITSDMTVSQFIQKYNQLGIKPLAGPDSGVEKQHSAKKDVSWWRRSIHEDIV